MDNLISSNSLTDTFVYIDDIIICGRTEEAHKANLAKFMKVVESMGITEVNAIST